jgi:hypothetical protein
LSIATFSTRPISAQVAVNMLTERSLKPYMPFMNRQISLMTFAAGLLALCGPLPKAWAGDQAKTIVNSLDSKGVNELFEVSRTQPDAALTNITPTTPNTFRFLFIWPSSNQIMTYDRVGRSFVERFAGFAGELKLLAVGFCLPARTMYFGQAFYGEQEINIAYRDIEVRYIFGRRSPCTGRFIPIAEIEPYIASAHARLPLPEAPPKQTTTPEEDLKPLFSPPAPAQ